MIPTTADIVDIAGLIAPPELALGYDNTGLIVGSLDSPVRRALVALDVTDAVAGEAARIGADIVITHHPVIFRPISAITSGTPLGARLIGLIRHGVAALAMHTNYDAAETGTNAALALALSIEGAVPFGDGENALMGRVGGLPRAESLSAFAARVKSVCGFANYCGEGDRLVSRVAVVCGAGGHDRAMLAAAKAAGADVCVTGDVSYHAALDALDFGLAVIDATHYGTESVAIPGLCREFAVRFAERGYETEAVVSAVNGQIFHHA